MVLDKPKVIDGRDHLLGRLASIVAKELLAGQKIVIVRCDEMCVSGSLVRNRVKYAQFRRKHMNTNPRRGPFHFKSPAKMVWRTIRGMVHQKTARGQEAISRLSTFEGIPAPFDKMKRVVVPAALRSVRIKSVRRVTVLGVLADSVGWKHKELLTRLEAKRKAESEEYFQKKKEKEALRKKAEAECAGELAKVNAVLAASGYA
uniref:60S ribosomal protein L13a n=1 Tax=Grammatophora oceanica TaxID=210454 RepID=A0A6U5HV31_9STRA|mmetsp:Transcript_19045/g.28174  ORF Transcript_19045/g.28174 Transcript_19045/m.28174 type:complete len:203 (+) Transcript_19045:53-661(+)|eukprot:CAMPEP_0194026696 /NCGR_PEP_ID=MMETSP0009_2-20130614/1004_1 /TAXON_ID=210454 /ORGANISM="Grammatophora oceanica, Strain CCMP 410" /LENGTH=202 /DNA_ID=CAMNT_0038665537 /DNA_START=52 /DNA_END=660 /DNA_ORIENTATION=-